MYEQFLIPIILKISKINAGVLLPIWGFRAPGIPPPLGEGPGDPRIPKWEKLEYCNAIKIIFYKLVIIFMKFKKIYCKKIYFIKKMRLCHQEIYKIVSR